MPRAARHPARSVALVVLLGGLAMLVPAAPSAAGGAAGEEADPTQVAGRSGVAWLAAQQQADGGFALAGLDAVETPETVLALAAEAQLSDEWSAREALDRIEALRVDASGPGVLDAVDDLAGGTESAVDAALLLTRVALPLGFDPESFDPGRDGRPVDLVTALDGAEPGDRAGALAEVVSAHAAIGEGVPEALVADLLDRQVTGGGWSATPDGDEASPGTTGRVVAALVAAGVAPEDGRLAPAVAVLAGLQHEDGGWGPEGESTAGDTAAATIALEAVGYDPDDVCWQLDLLEEETGRPTPSSHLIDTQRDDGRWGRSDEAVSTAVSVQVLSEAWWPIGGAPARSCGGGLQWPIPSVPPSLLVVVAIGLVGALGSLRILRQEQPAH